MEVEQRLAALETRVQAAEDQLEIIRLLNSYGPAVDSGSSQPAASLWIDEGAYDVGGGFRAVGHEDLLKIWENDGHMGLVNQGVSHLIATPRITVQGDTAEAVAYSYVVLRREEDWHVWRAAINHWTLVRTGDGWKIRERFNRLLNGAPESHEVMRRGLRP